MSDDQAVLTERRGRVLLITLNRPEARNAVNAALAQGIAAALDELDGSDDLQVGVRSRQSRASRSPAVSRWRCPAT
jgi:enoyl-CoA hydratase